MRSSRISTWLAAVLLAGAAASPGKAAAAAGTRVFLIGIDAATWDLIDPLLAAGKLPNLKKLMGSGCHAVLTSGTQASPLEWTSIATGKTAAKHGIQDWDPKLGFPPSTQRTVKALWNIFDDHGRSVLLSRYLDTWPAEKVRGVIVSERWPAFDGTPETVHPDDAFAPYDNRSVEDYFSRRPARERPLPSFSSEAADEFLIRTLSISLDKDQTATRAAELFLSRGRFDLFAIHLYGLDGVGHVFFSREPAGVVPRYYEYVDSLIGRLQRFASEDTVTVVVSDHGQRPDERRPDAVVRDGREWTLSGRHDENGILIASGKGVATCARRGRATVYDVTPTVLYLAGLPVADDMDGSPLLAMADGEFVRSNPVKRIQTHESPGTPRRDAPPAPENPELLDFLRKMGYLK